METRSKRKSTKSFKFSKSGRQRSGSKLIKNQPSLISNLLNLMDNQKAIVAVVRIKNDSDVRKLVPISFTAEKDNVPDDLQPLLIHVNNLVAVDIPGCKSFAALIVATGDDSCELLDYYKIFVNNYNKRKQKLETEFEERINNWINIGSLKISRVSATSLIPTSESDFNNILETVAAIKKSQRSKLSTTIEPEKEKNSLHQQPSTSAEIDNIPEQPDSEILSSLKKIKELSEKITHKDTKAAVIEIAKVLEKILCWSQYKDLFPTESSDSKSNDFAQVRLIPTKDRTKEIGDVVMIEGTLPVSARKYKKALSLRSLKPNEVDSDSSIILTNIVKNAFPKHWILNVTVRGSGGRTSIISVWNHKNPLANPCEGKFEKGLGEARLRALIDHVCRKANKSSYTPDTHKQLVIALGKAMHYMRKKFELQGKKLSKDQKIQEKDKIYTDSEEDESPSVISDNQSETDSDSEKPAKKTHKPFQPSIVKEEPDFDNIHNPPTKVVDDQSDQVLEDYHEDNVDERTEELIDGSNDLDSHNKEFEYIEPETVLNILPDAEEQESCEFEALSSSEHTAATIEKKQDPVEPEKDIESLDLQLDKNKQTIIDENAVEQENDIFQFPAAGPSGLTNTDIFPLNYLSDEPTTTIEEIFDTPEQPENQTILSEVDSGLNSDLSSVGNDSFLSAQIINPVTGRRLSLRCAAKNQSTAPKALYEGSPVMFTPKPQVETLKGNSKRVKQKSPKVQVKKSKNKSEEQESDDSESQQELTEAEIQLLEKMMKKKNLLSKYIGQA